MLALLIEDECLNGLGFTMVRLCDENLVTVLDGLVVLLLLEEDLVVGLVSDLNLSPLLCFCLCTSLLSGLSALGRAGSLLRITLLCLFCLQEISQSQSERQHPRLISHHTYHLLFVKADLTYLNNNKQSQTLSFISVKHSIFILRLISATGFWGFGEIGRAHV